MTRLEHYNFSLSEKSLEFSVNHLQYNYKLLIITKHSHTNTQQVQTRVGMNYLSVNVRWRRTFILKTIIIFPASGHFVVLNSKI